MGKRVVWKDDAVIVLKLNDELFTVGQMLNDPYVMFFSLWKTSDDFVALNLNETDELFTIPVARDFLQLRMVRKITKDVISRTPVELSRLWIRPRDWNQGEYVWKGGDLVRIEPDVGDLGMDNPIVKPDIAPNDADTLDRYELTNIWTDAYLVPRLSLCHKYNRNIDPPKREDLSRKGSIRGHQLTDPFVSTNAKSRHLKIRAAINDPVLTTSRWRHE